MDIIPVLDLKGGVVVRARMGQRDLYRPIETPLAVTSDARDVMRGLLSVYPFATVYVADLDAIEGRGDNGAALARLKAEWPDIVLWVDNGVSDASSASGWLARGLGHLVLGSESQPDLSVMRGLARDDRVILSLDFRGPTLQGPAGLLSDVSAWPDQVIVMTLARVGSGAGPDLERLAQVRAMAPRRRIYAAGGVRNASDLMALARAGIAGALVATSLHDGRLRRADIDRLAADPAASLR